MTSESVLDDLRVRTFSWRVRSMRKSNVDGQRRDKKLFKGF